MYLFGGPHAVAAAGADIFTGVAGLGWWRGSRGAATACSARGACPFDAVHIDVCPALFYNIVTQRLGGFGHAPPDARVIADGQVAGGGCIPEFFVVIRPAPAAILYPVLQVPEMHHLVQQGGRHILNRPVKRSCSDVQLVAVFLPFAPRFAHRYMAVCTRCALDGDYTEYLDLHG